MRRALWPVIVISAIGFCILLALGIWQVQRLAQKQNMLAQIETKMQLPAVPMEALATADLPFSKLKVTGQFIGAEQRKISTLKGGPGWEIVQHFKLEYGKIILVSRGVAGETQVATTPSTPVTIEGIVIVHNGGQGRFDADNNANSNQWYWWDVNAMLGENAPLSALPEHHVLHLLPNSAGTEDLQVEPPKANLRNNHLGYAITWFGLAAVLAVMTAAFLWRLRKEQLAASQALH